MRSLVRTSDSRSTIRISSRSLFVVVIIVAVTTTKRARLDRQDLLKGQPEVQVENGINNRIEGAVRVAEPSQYFKNDGMQVLQKAATILTQKNGTQQIKKTPIMIPSVMAALWSETW